MSAACRSFALIVSVLALSVSTARSETIVDDAGRYTVDIAQPATRSTTESAAATGKITNYVLLHDNVTTAEIVQYSDFAAGTLAGKDLAKLYDGAAQGGAANIHGVIRSLVVYQLGDVAGREMLVDFTANESKGVCRCRFYIVGDRLYALIYVGPAGSENDVDVLHFLNSFRLLR